MNSRLTQTTESILFHRNMSSSKDKFPLKQQQWVDRTALVIGVALEDTRELLRIGRQQSVRCNTLKFDVDTAEKYFSQESLDAVPFSWVSEGVALDSQSLKRLRSSELVENGSLYIQNAASWLPVLALDPKAGEAILDMCAAPGGKTSHIAARANNGALITANDNSKSRLHRLQANMDRLGVENIEFTLHDATRLSHKLEGRQFDKILLDAPCSGEGMMTLDNRKDFESWSVAHIKRLQQLQKKLIVQAWLLLKPGGTLVYSTCTMAPEENEAVVDYLLRRYTDAQLEQLPEFMQSLPNRVSAVSSWNGKAYSGEIEKTLRLKPSEPVEAFYVAKITKQLED